MPPYVWGAVCNCAAVAGIEDEGTHGGATFEETAVLTLLAPSEVSTQAGVEFTATAPTLAEVCTSLSVPSCVACFPISDEGTETSVDAPVV